MDKLNKLAMPDVKSGTPQEKMNAVNRMMKSLEMMTEAYNQIVPVINAKIDWLSEVEKVAKDDTQDKKIDELIAVNKALLGRIAKLESKGDYDDSSIKDRIKALESEIKNLMG